MRRVGRRLALSLTALCGALLFVSSMARAQAHEPSGVDPDPQAGMAEGHAGHASAEHGGAHGHEINLYYGFLGEKAGVVPSLACTAGWTMNSVNSSTALPTSIVPACGWVMS